MTNINEKIKDIISKNNVVLFMKGTPEMPQCGFSMTVGNILKELIGPLYLNFTLKENLLVAVILLKKCTKRVNYKKFLNKNYLE
jgi:glutaredoxin-related protein